MSKTTINIFHLGLGRVGTMLLRQVLENKISIEKMYSVKVNVVALFKSSGGIFRKNGIPMAELKKIATANPLNEYFPRAQKLPISLISTCPQPLIVIDTTASDSTTQLLVKALVKGAFVVCSNKKPLSSNIQNFAQLQKFHHRLFFETTVGAGLPIISTIKELLNTGDEILSITGCFSGTLGYIFSQLENGLTFSKAVKQAKELGYTELDPREDLSGMDVARKALILGRLLGHKRNISEINIKSLYPENLKNISVEEFLTTINNLDGQYERLINKAQSQNCTLRYVAEITPRKAIIGLKQVPKKSDIGSLTGPDNIVVIKTKRYNQNPLSVKGSGAGVEVTAAGVLGDVLKIIRIIKGVAL